MSRQGAGCLGVGWDDDIGGQVNLCEYRFSLGTLPSLFIPHDYLPSL